MILNTNSLDYLVNFLTLCESKEVEEIIISPSFYRSFKGCLSGNCGACCKKVTLLYFEGTRRWEDFKSNYPSLVGDFERVVLEGTNLVVYQNLQKENKLDRCTYLNKENGLCTIHNPNPLGCSFPMMKFIKRKEKIYFTSQTYGRKWSFKRVDGEKGALCFMDELDHETLSSNIDKLEELKFIGQSINLPVSRLTSIIELLKKDYLSLTKTNFKNTPKEKQFIK